MVTQTQKIEITFPRPHTGQQQVLESIKHKRWVTICAGRRWGKSLIVQSVALEYMLQSKLVGYVTPTHELGREFYKVVRRLIPDELIASENKTDRQIILVTGGSIKFFSGESEETLNQFRGNHLDLIIVDEAAFIPNFKAAWGTAMRYTLTDRRGKGLFISTPNGSTSFFHALYLKGLDPLEPNYESFHFTSYDNPYLSKDELDEIKGELTEQQIRVEMMAEVGETMGGLVDGQHIRNNTIEKLSTKPVVCFGIDIAFSESAKSDMTVVIGLDEDGAMAYFDRWQKGPLESIDRLALLPMNIAKCMDSTAGGGRTMMDLLLRKTHNLTGYQYSNTSKIQLVQQLALAIERNELKFNKITAQELETFEMVRKANGTYSVNARQGFRDDCCNALALALHVKRQATASKNYRLY